ncbi:MAG TPA: inorganic pyrophosphatase [Blastocatellia bacterium]|nr:inorganic pyrophosphatase [Blastocatellia bacterium]
MTNNEAAQLRLMSLLFRAHPWHGVSAGDRSPEIVTVYVEIVPTDTIKYELDKTTGLLKVDRPQRFSNTCPSYYGLIPQTFCGNRVGKMMERRTGRTGLVGDGDPLDICVFSEKTISHGNLLLRAVPIGGLSMIDNGKADDKIIAVMEEDAIYGGWTDIVQANAVIDRLKHYFSTYKGTREVGREQSEVTGVYGRDEARAVIMASAEDYRAEYSGLRDLVDLAHAPKDE